jgi:adenylate kinase
MTVICVSGTPGTGKTEVSKALAKKLGWKYVSLNELADAKKLYAGFDDERCCNIVDQDRVKVELDRISEMHSVVAESHYAHDMNCDWVVILRTKPDELRTRLKEKGWKKDKIEENILAELMEVCKSEALENFRKIIEIDTTGKGPESVAGEIEAALKKRKVIQQEA